MMMEPDIWEDVIYMMYGKVDSYEKEYDLEESTSPKKKTEEEDKEEENKEKLSNSRHQSNETSILESKYVPPEWVKTWREYLFHEKDGIVKRDISFIKRENEPHSEA